MKLNLRDKLALAGLFSGFALDALIYTNPELNDVLNFGRGGASIGLTGMGYISGYIISYFRKNKKENDEQKYVPKYDAELREI